MKKIVLLAFVLVLLLSGISGFATQAIIRSHSVNSTLVSGYISENTTWTLDGSPYIVVEDIVVQEAVFLTIEAGVVVKFTNGTSIIVDGALIARGNVTHKITFTSNSSTPNPGDWKGIEFRDTSIDSECTLDHVIVEYGGSSSDCPAIHAEKFSLNLRNCTIRSNKYPLISNNATFQNCTIINNEYWVDSNEIIMKNSIVANNTYGVNAGDGVLENSIITDNTYGVSLKDYGNLIIKNCTIIKNQEYGLYSSLGSAKIYNSTISYNKFGIKILTHQFYVISYTSIEIYNSSITYNQAAVETEKYASWRTLEFGLNFRITACEISYNNYGIRSAGTLEVYQSVISHNNGTAINHTLSRGYPSARLGTLSIVGSTIVSNNGNGICVSPYSEDISEVVEPVINFCNLYNNTSYDVVSNLQYGNDVNATYNWWGTTNATLISEHIYDYYNNFSIGKVFYEPFLLLQDLTPPLIGTPSHEPEVPKPDQKVTVSVNVTDDSSGVREVTLSYNIDGGATWVNVTMSKTAEDTYTGEIPEHPAGTSIQYNIIAYDNMGKVSIEDKNGQYYIYTVVPEFPTWTSILLILIVLTAAIAIYKRRLLK